MNKFLRGSEAERAWCADRIFFGIAVRSLQRLAPAASRHFESLRDTKLKMPPRASSKNTGGASEVEAPTKVLVGNLSGSKNLFACGGFTVIELIITIGILAVIFGYGAVVSVRYYQNSLLASERDKLISALSLARSRALDNINESDHGLYIGSEQYTVYQGVSYASRNASFDEHFPRETSVSAGGLTDISFRSPDGSASPSGSITLSGGSKTFSVSINGEGMIDY